MCIKNINEDLNNLNELVGYIFLSYKLWETYEITLENKNKIDYINIHCNYMFTIQKAALREYTLIQLSKLFDKNSYINIYKFINKLENNSNNINRKSHEKIEKNDILLYKNYYNKNKNKNIIDAIKEFRNKNICHSDKEMYTNKNLTIYNINKLLIEIEEILENISYKLKGEITDRKNLKYNASNEYNNIFNILLDKEHKRLKSIKKD